MRTSGSLTLVPALGTLFLLSCSCVQLQHDIFCIILLYFTLVMVGCYCLEACSFLMKDRKGLDLEGSWDWEEMGGFEGGEPTIRIWENMREREGGREREKEKRGVWKKKYLSEGMSLVCGRVWTEISLLNSELWMSSKLCLNLPFPKSNHMWFNGKEIIKWSN